MGLNPGGDGVFAGYEVYGVALGASLSTDSYFALPFLDAEDLFLGQAQFNEAKAAVADGLQLGEDAAGGALGGRGGVVQLVGKVAGEFAEGSQLLALLLNTGDFADAIEQGGDDA